MKQNKTNNPYISIMAKTDARSLSTEAMFKALITTLIDAGILNERNLRDFIRNYNFEIEQHER